MPALVNKKRIVMNTFFLYTKTFITMLIAFYSTRLILEGLGKMDFGIYGTVGGAIVMLESLNLAMAQATQRFMNYAEGGNDREHLVSIFNNTVLLHIALGCAIVFLMMVIYYPLFHGVFNIPEERIVAAKFIYVFLAVSAFFTIITVPYDAMINAHEDFLYYSIVGIVMAVLKLLAAIVIFSYSSDRLILYGFLMAGIAIVNMVIMRIYCRYKYKECTFRPKQYGNLGTMKELGVFAGWNFVGAFANMAGNHGSTILMNHFFGPILIAAKNIGDQICSQVAILTHNMTKALNPVIVKSEGGGARQTMIDLSFISCRFSFLLYLVLAVPFLFNTELLLRFWLKQIPEWAILFSQLQVIRTLFEQLFMPLRMSLMAQGSVKQMNMADLVLGVVTFFVLYLLYSMGLKAYWHYYVSIIMLVFLSGVIKLALCRKLCGMQVLDFCRRVLWPCLAVLVFSSFFSLFLYHVLHFGQTWCNTVWELLVVGAFVLLCGLFRSERQLIKDTVRKNTEKVIRLCHNKI